MAKTNWWTRVRTCTVGAVCLVASIPMAWSQQEQLPADFSPASPTRDELRPPSDNKPLQRALVREKFAGWQQAGAGENGLDQQLRSNWVMMTSAGLLNGELVAGQGAAIDNVLVTLLHRGQVINQTRTGADGKFSFNNLVEGAYSVVAFSQNAFCAFEVNILEYKASTADALPKDLKIRVVQNKTTINLDWIRHFAPGVQFRIYGRFVTREGTEDPASLYGLEGISTHGPAAIPATSVETHPVRLGPGGELIGRVHQLDEQNGRPVDLRSTRVLLLRENDVAQAVSADNHGVFRFTGVEPGDYSLVAAGSDGIGCIGIEAVADHPEPRVLDFTMISPDAIGWLNSLAIETAYLRITTRKMAGNNCQECNPFNGDLSRLYCNRDNPFRQFWDSINSYFDLAFYGETFTKPGYYGSGGGVGGGMGGPGCPQCGGGGCQHCQPSLPGTPHYLYDPNQGFAVPPPVDCGGCGQPSCPSCGRHPGAVPTTPVPIAPEAHPSSAPGFVPTPAQPLEPIPRQGTTSPLQGPVSRNVSGTGARR